MSLLNLEESNDTSFVNIRPTICATATAKRTRIHTRIRPKKITVLLHSRLKRKNARRITLIVLSTVIYRIPGSH